MFIEPGGGIDGIKEYLETGRKEGREYSRAEMDERVILAGDLDITDSIIQSTSADRERYLHYTISFKEDQLDRETLRKITQDFEKFAFCAYQKDEYCFYAEAHIPKIKTYIDKRTGELVERKPHIHVVIPKTNLLSGHHLNPFGMVDKSIGGDKNSKFIDAFQEYCNHKYGLASPKDNRRVAFQSTAEMISRYKGDIFETQKELKQKILTAVLERNISQYDDFKTLLSEFGETRTRNQGKTTEYQNIRLANAPKGINLKEFVFSREFIESSDTEKQSRLAAAQTAQPKYEVAGQPRRPPEELKSILREWQEVRAKEVKYLNSGNRKAWREYQQANREERIKILAGREAYFYSKNQPEPHFPNTNHKEFRKKYERTYEFKQGQQRDFSELAKQQSLSRTKSLSKVKSLSQITKEKSKEVQSEIEKPRKSRDIEHRVTSTERNRSKSSRAKTDLASRQRSIESTPQRTPSENRNNLRSVSGSNLVRVQKVREMLLPGDETYKLEIKQARGRADRLRRLYAGDEGRVDRELFSEKSLTSSSRDASPIGNSDNVTGQFIRDTQQDKNKRTYLDEFREIRKSLDASRLLAEMSQTRGLIVEKYQISQSKDGSDRIKCGNRRLNVSDFLTQELHLPWKEAAQILRESYARQRSLEPKQEPTRQPRWQIWAEFQEKQKKVEQERGGQWKAQREKEKERRAVIKVGYSAKKDEIRNRKIAPVERKALMSLARMERLAKEVALRETIKSEREHLKAQKKPMREQYRDYLVERSQKGDQKALAELRRMRFEPPKKETITTRVIPVEQQTIEEVPIYRDQAITYQVHHNGDVTYQRDGTDMLRDQGRAVTMLKEDTQTIVTGLRLAQLKFGKDIKLLGSSEFQEKVARVAAEQNITIEFSEEHLNKIMDHRCAELAAEAEARILAREKEKTPAIERDPIEKDQTMSSRQLDEFKRYHQAVNADRYRVTSIKMEPDGGKKAFILGKREGFIQGFTVEELEKRTPEMQRLDKRGENLYYTPLSDKRHHILVDDMSREKVERFIGDGYKPAVLMESSPGNYQAILTVPKLGTEHDRHIANRLAERLNKEYGDPNLSGAIHPHRAPAFANHKPERQKEDGTYPEVRLIKAERRECEKTLEMSREIDAQYKQQAKERVIRLEREPVRERVTFEGEAIERAVEVYQRHHRDVMKRQGAEADLSRVDSMVAIRMRVTGHSQEEIAGALRKCASAMREQPEAHDWDDYAERTVSYAFSPKGDQQAAELGRYRNHWKRLEQTRTIANKDRELPAI